MTNKRRYTLRNIAVALVFIAAVAVGAAKLLLPPASNDVAIPARPLHATPVTLVRVVDGDTIVVRLSDGREERVRYIGIDAPEYDARTDTGQAFGQEAHNANAELLGNGPLWLALDREHRDRFGRLLAYVYTDTDFVNAALIRDGLAHVLVIEPNVKHMDLLLQLQAEALAAGHGLWGAAAANIVDWRDATGHIDTAATVEGVIVRTHKDSNSGMTFLNFSTNIREHFVAIVSEQYGQRFPRPPESNYSGRRVRVRGLVESHEGQPQIAVQIYEQIEVLD